jgi:outer membrane protein OmpA-like peptidoglycan-associated protein
MHYLQLISPFLVWVVAGFGGLTWAQNTSQKDSTIHILGSCWDISTGVDLKVKAHATVNGDKVYIGESNDDGLFDLSIPRTTTELTFESKGYRTVTTPVSVQGKTSETDKFGVSFRMISINSQQVIKAYLPKLPTNKASEVSQQEVIPSHFEVRDVYLRKLLTARICLNFSSGQTYCLDTDSLIAPIATFVGELGNINVTVTSEGYHTYTGSLKAKNMMGEALYSIQLLRELNPVSLGFNVPRNLDLTFLLSKNGRFGTSLDLKKGKNWHNMLFDPYQSSSITGSVQITVLESSQHAIANTDGDNIAEHLADKTKAGQKILLNDSYTMFPGLILKAIHVESPIAEIADALVTGAVVSKPIPAGSVTLYFDQSSYQLRTRVKVVLDSISELLKNNPGTMVKLTGHTDNVGRRDLNIRLSVNTGEGSSLTTC